MSLGNPIWFQAILVRKRDNFNTFVICCGVFFGMSGGLPQFQFVQFMKFLLDYSSVSEMFWFCFPTCQLTLCFLKGQRQLENWML